MGEFIHSGTDTRNIDVEEETIVVSATVNTMFFDYGPVDGPNLDFTLELPAADLVDAYQRAVERCRELEVGRPVMTKPHVTPKRVLPAIFSARRAISASPNPRMRDCVQCHRPFFSRGARNVVCVVCKSQINFDGGL